MAKKGTLSKLLVAALLAVSLTGFSEVESEAAASDIYGIGDVWEVPGQWRIAVNSVSEMSERNQYSDKTPEAVYLIEYTYENIGYVDNIMDGLFIQFSSGQIVDAEGEMGYAYPNSVTSNPTTVPVGASCTAQSCIGVNHAGNFTILLSQYDGTKTKQEATFFFVLSAPANNVLQNSGTKGTGAYDPNGYNIGETWTVPGQWELTIDSVRKTSDRNQYANKSPAAVYIIDYTYKNTGYVDYNGIMDGLFIQLSSGQIVDAAGEMGYSYPNSVSSNPQQTPVGATCKAQSCIAVNHDGDFTISLSEYDGTRTKQTATFNCTVQ